MAQLAEWKERVAACRSSGISVRAWYREREIAVKTYYYWEKEILSEAGRQAELESGRGSRFIGVPALAERSVTAGQGPVLAAKLRIKNGELEIIYAGADGAVLEMLLGALKDAQ